MVKGFLQNNAPDLRDKQANQPTVILLTGNSCEGIEPSMKHNFKKIEPKWQKKWEEQQAFKAVDGSDKPKFYGLVEFPYPSGAGMHVGHIKAYSSIEVLSRKRRMQGYNVLFPIGFDAFGLPTENYAIKTNTHPREITDQNIAKFTNQLKSVGFS